MRDQLLEACEERKNIRITEIFKKLSLSASSWYRKKKPKEFHKKPGPPAQEIPKKVRESVVQMAKNNPWYGYKKIAVMCRRAGHPVKTGQAYRVMKEENLLQQRKLKNAGLYQSSKLYELLPQGPNDLWQMDVTYIYIPEYGWRYAVTVIDYYSRYLLACHLSWSYSAACVIEVLKDARGEAQRIHGDLNKPPFLVTDNGSSFIARRFVDYVKDDYSQVRIRYRTPTQLGLLERMHKTIKEEEVYWRLYENPDHAQQCLNEFRQRYNHQRPHWALIPEQGGDPVTPEDVYIQGQCIQIPKWQKWAREAKKKLEKSGYMEAA